MYEEKKLVVEESDMQRVKEKIKEFKKREKDMNDKITEVTT